MSTPRDPQATALLAHVVSQMQSNVDFLVSQNYISSSDASTIMSRLPTDAGVNHIVPRAQAMSVSAPQAPARRGVPAPSRNVQQARALWAYNEHGQVIHLRLPYVIILDQLDFPGIERPVFLRRGCDRDYIRGE